MRDSQNKLTIVVIVVVFACAALASSGVAGNNPVDEQWWPKGQDGHTGHAVLQRHAPGAWSDLRPQHSWRWGPHARAIELAGRALCPDLHGRVADGGNRAGRHAVGRPRASDDPDPRGAGVAGRQLFL